MSCCPDFSDKNLYGRGLFEFTLFDFGSHGLTVPVGENARSSYGATQP